jgi:thioredoxin-dependent peroxiredoxin
MFFEQEPPLLEVGAEAPDFTLPASDGGTVRLSSFRGRRNVVLIFYPRDSTPGCTRQLCAARDDAARYEAAAAVRFGVNPGSAASHQRFAEKHGFDFPLLVDAEREVARAYGVVAAAGKKVHRTVYAIGTDGRVAFAARGYPETDEILGAVAS